MKIGYEARIECSFASDSFNLYVINHRPDGKRDYALPLTMAGPLEPGMIVPITVQLPQYVGQQLMDDLWSAGVRPRNGSGGPAQVEAMQAHLRDLQRLVFDRTDIQQIVEHERRPGAIAAGSF